MTKPTESRREANCRRSSIFPFGAGPSAHSPSHSSSNANTGAVLGSSDGAGSSSGNRNRAPSSGTIHGDKNSSCNLSCDDVARTPGEKLQGRTLTPFGGYTPYRSPHPPAYHCRVPATIITIITVMTTIIITTTATTTTTTTTTPTAALTEDDPMQNLVSREHLADVRF